MASVPENPRIYHITHVENLPAIIAGGGLVSDARMIARGGPAAAIGMSDIKRRRVEELEVSCHPGTKVGDYVPFYFCPRSIMLYVIHQANHPSLTYRGGQGPIVHLEAPLRDVAAWADAAGRPWAFSLSNAGATYAEFRASLAQLDQIDWKAVEATDFRPSHIKEGKQAEFLVHDSVAWEQFVRIGVRSQRTRAQVESALSGTPHQPKLEIRGDWYY
jgi:hypothetical protein